MLAFLFLLLWSGNGTRPNIVVDYPIGKSMGFDFRGSGESEIKQILQV